MEKLRNLLVGEFLVFAKENDFAKFRRKLLDCRPHLVALDLTDVTSVRICTLTRRGIGLASVRIQFNNFRSGTPLPQLVQPDITQDGEQPALYVAVGGQSAKRPKSAQTGLLHQIFGFRGIS